MLRRYWLEFFRTNQTALPGGLKHGCGVTARSFDDALHLVKTRIFPTTLLPVIERIITNVDVSTLDEQNVLAHMWAPVWRGVWFPLGFQDNTEPEEETARGEPGGSSG